MGRNVIDTLIIGGGPAGLTSATYLARFRRSVVVAHADDSRAALIPMSRNCPGFPDGIAGPELLSRLRQQAERFGASVHHMPVRSLKVEDGLFTAAGENGEMVARTVLLATGVADLAPDMPNFAISVARGRIRLCPVCDAFEETGRRIAVIGGSDHALKEAMFLRDYTDRVSMLVNGAHEIADHTREAAARAGIDVLDSVADIVDGDGLAIALADGAYEQFDVIYPALGCNVRSELAASIGADCDENGYILVDAHQRTSIQGLWAAGDVVSALNQIAVAFGQAALAATAIHNSLRGDLPI